MYFKKNANFIILWTANVAHWLLKKKCQRSPLSILRGPMSLCKGQVRFMDQPNIVNIKNSEIGVLLVLSSRSPLSVLRGA